MKIKFKERKKNSNNKNNKKIKWIINIKLRHLFK